VVNGYVSNPATFHAGVRQGCPLSPLLYLFIGQALLSWLKHKGIGIKVGNTRITQGQYADDATPLLESLAKVDDFHKAMQTFGEATGQRLNVSKTQLLRIGQLGPVPADVTVPYTIVTEAVTLGIRFSNTAPTPAQLKQYWQPKLDNVYKCLQKLARMPLSAFGRAFGAGGYALSTLLYHAEYMGLPPKGMLKQLQAKVAAIVDRKGNRLTGVTGALLVGSPVEGGFGLLPLEQHIQGRRARWGLAALSAPLQGWPAPAWVTVLRQLAITYHVSATPFSLLTQKQLTHTSNSKGVAVPYPLTAVLTQRSVEWPPAHAIFTSLSYLEHSRFYMQASPRLGSWIQHAPFFSNPMLCQRGLYTPRSDTPQLQRTDLPPEWRSVQVAECLSTDWAQS
jgi:hypothetical protein